MREVKYDSNFNKLRDFDKPHLWSDVCLMKYSQIKCKMKMRDTWAYLWLPCFRRKITVCERDWEVDIMPSISLEHYIRKIFKKTNYILVNIEIGQDVQESIYSI